MAEKFIDLHFHSHFSGGCLAPADLVKRAKINNFSVICLTDHNTVAGIPEFLAQTKKSNILGLPGVEIYVTYKKHLLHLLAYNINYNDLELNSVLKKLCQKRINLINQTIKKLNLRGLRLKFFSTSDKHYPDVTAITNQLINNPKNLALVRKITKRLTPDLFTLINAFLAKKGLVYLPETSLPIELALKLIRRVKGVPILAHPGQQLRWSEDKIILELKKLGLKGIEALTPYHNWHQIEHYQEFARVNKLLITGGSDYHCDIPQNNILIKKSTDYFRVPLALFNQLKPYLR